MVVVNIKQSKQVKARVMSNDGQCYGDELSQGRRIEDIRRGTYN